LYIEKCDGAHSLWINIPLITETVATQRKKLTGRPLQYHCSGDCLRPRRVERQRPRGRHGLGQIVERGRAADVLVAAGEDNRTDAGIKRPAVVVPIAYEIDVISDT
jgi:hypothetical protein